MAARQSIYGVSLLLLVTACSQGPPAPGPVTAELARARDQAAEYGAIGNEWSRAFAAIQPFADRDDAAAEDLLRAANALLADQKAEEARPYVERAAARAPDDPGVAWCRYRIAIIEGRFEEALGHLDQVLSERPDDLPARLARAILLYDLDRLGEAVALTEELLDVPVEYAGSWRVTTVYRHARLLTELGRGEDAKPFFEEYESLKENVPAAKPPAHQRGTLGEIRPHSPTALALAPPEPRSVSFRLEPFFLPDTEPKGGLALVRYEWGELEDLTELWKGDRRPLFPEEAFRWTPPQPVLLVWGATGLVEMRRSASGDWGRLHLIREDVLDVVPFDRKNAPPIRKDERVDDAGDPDVDLIVALRTETGAEIRLLERSFGRWMDARPLLFTTGAAPEAGRIVPVDYDHDGDLDLVAGVDGRARLFRNDGFDARDDGFTELTDEIGLPRGDLRPIAEDLDSDQDVDLLFVDVGSGAVSFWSNQRGGRFEDASATLPDGLSGRHVVAADLDGDGRVDLAAFGAELHVHVQNPLGGWKPALVWPLPEVPTGAPAVEDWDGDGTNDLFWPAREAPAIGLLAPGLENGGARLQLGPGAHSGPATVLAADLDGDADLDLVRLDGTGFYAFTNEDTESGALLGLQGDKDNAHGLGAVVELRSGLRYRRIYWRGTPRRIGFAGRDTIDVVRVTWPNGAVQSFLDVPAQDAYVLWQRRGLVGSCPFLYTWNGETYEFISDVLGITPLGLPMEPGLLVPPDHDEYVLVRGDQLRPKDGHYEVQFTEELREVTYLDRIRLEVVDHPPGVEVFPNERFSFPPFPEHHVHTVRDPLAPLRATDGEGNDWRDALAADDRRFAYPFTPLYGQFQGLAEPYYLELAFDAERVRAAEKLRLLMNGWLVWTNASVNVAAARHPERAFVPPVLQVPDGEGGWRDAGPPLGFPAGKLKTMVIDVTELVDRADPRIRLVSTLELYWDSIRLAVDDDDATLAITSIEPASANLWERGFSRPIRVEARRGLEWFEWDQLARFPRWDQHPGWYTRYGETLPLVTEIDDRFVIMGAGDALCVRFDASQAPPLKEGWTRDFLVFLDGWAKDRDPNTVEALRVEPLPFHGMSGYPYGPDEAFPDDEAHRSWRREWNTRPSKRLIEPLATTRP